jgi:hypothetical protein
MLRRLASSRISRWEMRERVCWLMFVLFFLLSPPPFPFPLHHLSFIIYFPRTDLPLALPPINFCYRHRIFTGSPTCPSSRPSATASSTCARNSSTVER